MRYGWGHEQMRNRIRNRNSLRIGLIIIIVMNFLAVLLSVPTTIESTQLSCNPEKGQDKVQSLGLHGKYKHRSEGYTGKSVYLFNDDRYANLWYESKTSLFIVNYIQKILNYSEIECGVVDANILSEIISSRTPSETIIVFTQDVVPDTVWNGSSSSLIVQWLWAGGTIVWSGTTEFYYIGFKNGSYIHKSGIENIPFDGPVTIPAEINISLLKRA